MSQIVIPGAFTYLPIASLVGSSAYATVTLNATGETCAYVGYIILENPLGGSKTISSAGGGKIVWRTGTTTFANGSSVFDVGIQDVSTASSPSQGDGTFDVKASFTGGGGGITSAAVQTSTMTSGTKTIAHGDLIAIVFSGTTMAGADSVIISTNGRNVSSSINGGFPTVTDNTGGSYARTASASPNAYILFDDGTIGWLYGSNFGAIQPGGQAYNSSTGTADEYGNFIKYPGTFVAMGIQFVGQLSGTSADVELLLYTDPLGTPSVVRTITVDATQWPATATTLNTNVLFSTPYTLQANTPYAVTLRPTTANNATVYYRDTDTAVGAKSAGIGTYNYAVRRLNNTGAFTEYNGGTANTRQMTISLIGSSLEQGVNFADYRLGI